MTKREFKAALYDLYRWAATSSREIDEENRNQDAFIQQIKRVTKKIGFRA